MRGLREFSFWILIVLSCHAAAAGSQQILAPDGKPITEVPADPKRGFNFPYLLYVPATAKDKLFPYLLVEMNNTPDLSHNIKDLSLEEKSATKVLTSFSLGNGIAERLGAAFLVPIFPRPALGSDGDLYTYSLSRPTMLIASGPLIRIDNQLVAMIADARVRLAAQARPVSPQILIDGFSASAMFASRFVFLHPELVHAAAFGAVNAFFMLPLRELKGNRLDYPLGLGDYASIAGHDFDPRAYNAVPQFAFMGQNDTNDAVVLEGGDAYDKDEASLIYSLLGKKMLPDRWQAVRTVYQACNPRVTFRTYSDVGHGLDERIWAEVAAFFRTSAVSKLQ